MCKKYKILIIDDEEIACETYRIQLHKMGYNIESRNRASAGLEILEGELPDLILMDVMMPELDGYTACKKIKSNAKWKNIPIILITALEGKYNIIKGLESGADEFLSKPVNGPELRARVRSMLRIKQQYDDLEESMKTREYLSHMIMHDVRNPLLSIAMMCELSMAKNRGDTINSHNYDMFKKIHNEAKQLNSFINDMLLVTKLESGKLKLNTNLIDIEEMALKAVRNHEMLAKQRDIKIKVEIPGGFNKQLCVDANLFLRVLDNLLSNAIKFSPDLSIIIIKIGEQIETTTSKSEQNVTIQVIDNGNGISNENKIKIFNKYETVELNRQHALQTGFGLAFCKMVISAHNGRIYVKDNEPRGSKFVIEM